MKKLRIFLASPSDVDVERNIVPMLVDELQRTIGDILEVDLELVRWETHSWPDVGDDAQDVINKQIGEYDIFIGIMWKRFGTPTKRASSGTGEEFERAYEYFKNYHRPKIMFYFRTTPFFTKDIKEWSQFSKVIKYRRKLQQLGVFVWEYDEPLEFERRVREHLIRQVREITEQVSKVSQGAIRKTKREGGPPKLFFSYVRPDTNSVEPIYELLKTEGFAPWMDSKDILPGQRWTSAIETAIHNSDFFVAFFSQNSLNRRGFINREIGMALDIWEKKHTTNFYIIPVRLEPVDLPAPFTEFQWIDVFSVDDRKALISAINSLLENKRTAG